MAEMTRRRGVTQNAKRRDKEKGTQPIWADKGIFPGNDDPSGTGQESRASNEDLRDTNEDLSLVSEEDYGPSQEDESQTGNASDKGSNSQQAPAIERDENSNPISFSCSAAVKDSSKTYAMRVAFDYQMYFHPTRPADLKASIAIVEGRLIQYIAEASGLPTSDEDDCSGVGAGRGSKRFVRRSLKGRKKKINIVEISAGDPDEENQIDANCVERTIETETMPLDCVPISGTVEVQIGGKSDDMHAENFVKGSARTWMETYGDDYEQTVPGLVELEFLGTRTYDPEVGRDYVEPVMPEPAAAAVQTVPEPLTDDEKPTYLGYALATALCLGLVLTFFIAARKMKKRCSDDPKDAQQQQHPAPAHCEERDLHDIAM